jgi:hypothetical protein
MYPDPVESGHAVDGDASLWHTLKLLTRCQLSQGMVQRPSKSRGMLQAVQRLTQIEGF